MKKNSIVPARPANRHERRRQMRTGEVIRMDMKDVLAMASMCAWEGCHCTTADPDKDGWSKMLLYTGKTRSSFLEIDPRRMARDCVLCPEHAGYLDGHLLIDVGGRLRHVEGTA